MDKHSHKIYFWPESAYDMADTMVASQLQTVLRIQGTEAAPVEDLCFSGITFAHTTTMYLKQKYSVPRSGDW